MLSHSAGVFEAFVGGLHTEQGLGAVEEWLSPLLLPFISAEYEICRQELRCVNHQDNSDTSVVKSPATWDATSPVAAPTGTLAELNEKLINQKLFDQVEWSEVNVAPGKNPTFPVWLLTARYEGGVIGEARAPRKKEAKNLAAVAALKDLQSKGILF